VTVITTDVYSACANSQPCIGGEAYCPSDHPYVIGGGARDGQSPLYASVPEAVPGTQQGWFAMAPSTAPFLETSAICAK
jgi:hypothetical protein